MPTNPIPALEATLAHLRSRLYASEIEADTETQSDLANQIFSVKAQLDPLKRAAGLIDNSDDAMRPVSDSYDGQRPRARAIKRSTRRRLQARRVHFVEIEALSNALAGVIDPTTANLDPAAWIAGFHFGRKLRLG